MEDDDWQDDECIDENAISLPILLRGTQWAITGYGLECLEEDDTIGRGHYYISADQLGYASDDGDPTWPSHMAGKNWVDIDDFCAMFEKAIVMHKADVSRLRDDWKERMTLHIKNWKRNREIGEMLSKRTREFADDDGVLTSFFGAYAEAEKQLVAEGKILPHERLYSLD